MMKSNQFVEIRKSNKHGNGLFALRDFREGEKVYSFKKGKVVSRENIDNLSEEEKRHLDCIGKDKYEVVEPPGCYINHSCEPNVGERNRTGYALRTIKKGEEITVDYDKIAYLEEPFECNCGSSTCRSLIEGKESGLLGEKWNKLLKLAKKFRHVPFVEFVLVAGSMATGEAGEESDFDVIVGARTGRIFTVRQLASGLFELIGKRRKKGDNEVKDKICLNHYVTSEGYRLDPPHNEYWVHLYNNLVPVHGSRESIKNFFGANEWAGEVETDFNRLNGKKGSFLKKLGEFLLRGRFGNLLEKKFRKYQIRRIEENLEENMGYKPQVKYDDTELRFHMDTKRIEEWIERNIK